MTHTPVTTSADLAMLDDVEILEGFLDGYDPGSPEPGPNRSRSYWHGWQNGRADLENRSRPESIALIRDMKRLNMWPFGKMQ